MITIIPKTHEEWLQERQNGLGASDAGSIIGVNPWKTNVQLWREKTGLEAPEDIGDKPQVQYGKAAEEHIRALFALDHPELQVTYESPYKIIHSRSLPFIFCTPDGELYDPESGLHGGLEIKTAEIVNGQKWAEWEGRIPDTYYAQVCHQMIAAGWEFVYLRAQLKYRTKDGDIRSQVRDYYIDRGDAMEDIDALKDAEIDFWERVQTKDCPDLILPMI